MKFEIRSMVKLIIFLIIYMDVLYADRNKFIRTYCFESSYIFMDEGTKVEKVVLHFEDFNHDIEYSLPVRMFYMLENDNRRYSVPNVFMDYNKKTNIYSGGVECDGGLVEFNATNSHLQIEGLRMSEACGEIMPPFGFKVEKVELDDSLENIVEISNEKEGYMSIGFLDKNKQIDYSKGKLWIRGKKCTSPEYMKESKIFYTEKEYMETFKTSQKEDEYIHLFDEPFVERENFASPIETIKLQKVYSNIAEMMNTEGFNFQWMKSYTIRFFLYNNKRAFIQVDNDATSGCFSTGYYLLELNKNILKKMNFGWEFGSLHTPILFEN